MTKHALFFRNHGEMMIYEIYGGGYISMAREAGVKLAALFSDVTIKTYVDDVLEITEICVPEE